MLDGLRDLLRRQRREWTMVFALGGAAALRELDAQPFDVVVTDMRMPDIDGATLLGLVRQRYPQSVRIVLSGQTELEAALRLVPVAHQVLAKPCDREQLRRAIERACVSQALLTDEAVRRAAGGAEALPSAPTLYTNLVEASSHPDASMDEIGALVESDIAMSAKVLQLVNSSFFGLGRRISSAREAVVYLGIAPLRAVVLCAGAFRAFAPAHPIAGFDVEALEAHSTLVARVAAELLPDKHAAAEAFTAGMLHDVGKLVLAAHQPDQLASLLITAGRCGGRPLHDIEQEHAQVTHAEIGGYLLTRGGFPIGSSRRSRTITRRRDSTMRDSMSQPRCTSPTCSSPRSRQTAPAAARLKRSTRTTSRGSASPIDSARGSNSRPGTSARPSAEIRRHDPIVAGAASASGLEPLGAAAARRASGNARASHPALALAGRRPRSSRRPQDELSRSDQAVYRVSRSPAIASICVLDETLARASSPGPGARVTASSPKPRVLCVDDEPHVLESLRDTLRRRFDVVVTTNASTR